ncbi:MAG TPA: glycosyltransferase family 2 protein [Candidatus Saccharimonadales bacterium]|nr:glycosyltransferase family 2 protein [Candidatus Saccharimonadales bacterium]
MTVTCIIPFFNERDRILKVLDGIVKIKGIDQFLLIDDGSTDGSAELVRKHYPKLTIIRNPKNLGKTEAISVGLKQTKGTHVFLLDADLQNFQYKEVENAILAVKNAPTIDMIILKRKNKRLLRANTLISGERILQKQDLLELLAAYQPKGFQVELAINQYMLENHKNVYWMPISAVNTSSIKKRGVISGIQKIIGMHIEIVTYIGLYNTFRQVLSLAKSEYIS